MQDSLLELLEQRFGRGLRATALPEIPETWLTLSRRGSCRRFRTEPLPPEIIESLCALSLCSPTKSDLQQRDIILIEDAAQRAAVNALLTQGPLGQSWIAEAPHLLVFCGNNRRQRQIQDWREKDFANDHFDALFNAAVDAGVALSAFVLAAESAGFGCCPISAIRNHAEEVSGLLGLPDHVFPVAGLGLGHPAEAAPNISLRLPLSVTLHRDRYHEGDLPEAVTAYDRRREAAQPYSKQRYTEDFGETDDYGWSEDKARQYAKPERAGFGAFLRAKGFKFD